MSPRERFAATATHLLDERDDVAVVYAEISGQYFHAAKAAHPERVINVGIREQLLVSAGAGLALTGVRPIVHTFAPFLVSRAYEQVKLDFAHQDVGGVLVSTGGSYDMAALGRTHQGPEDVALMMTVPGAVIHAPGTADEVEDALREATAADDLRYVRVSDETNSDSHPQGVHQLRQGSGELTLLAFGPLLDDALRAADRLDAGVVYVNRLTAADAAALPELVRTTDVAVVEPWLEGTVAHWVQQRLLDAPRRLFSLGVSRTELRRYGTPEQHKAAHGLDADGIVARLGRR